MTKPAAPMPGPADPILGEVTIQPLPVPHDCIDGFAGAFWRRPEAYLDPQVQAGMSAFTLTSRGMLDDGLSRLQSDLVTGEWCRRHAELLDQTSFDVGYRLVVANH